MTEILQTRPRFDGAIAWMALTPEQQAVIGAIALEYIVNWHGQDAHYTGAEVTPESRPFEAADSLLGDLLMDAVSEAIGPMVPALFDDALQVPIPSLIGGVCRGCGCSDNDACEGGCSWAEPDLCSACVGRAS